MENKDALLILIIGIVVGLGFGLEINRLLINIFVDNAQNLQQENLYQWRQETKHSAMKLASVSLDNETGVAAYLFVTVEKGTGRVLLNVNNILMKYDTQNSARMAALVATNYTNIDMDSVDITYDIVANAALLEGPSAGAAITIATISALEDKPLREDVMITGVINHDGSITSSGKILGKARAAKSVNASIFLVPPYNSEELVLEESLYCRKWGLADHCNVELIPKRINIEEEAGIRVIEVGSLEEALPYFFND